jgi:hypothetical protein
MIKNGFKAWNVNVSGKTDSVFTILPCKLVSEKPSSIIKKVKEIIQTIHSTEATMKCVIDFVKIKNLDHVIIDQSDVINLLSSTNEKSHGYEALPISKSQLKSYMKILVSCFLFQLLSAAGILAIVAGAGNYDEE